ncbi:hypothetical protein JCM3775_000904 [Rhodotorula graminis]
MHRVLATTRLLRSTNARTFASSSCWCQSEPSNTSDQPPQANAPPEPAAAYSLPQDAFAGEDHSSSAASFRPSTRPPTSKPRQRQFLSTAEAQAFADLLGEILPRSSRPPDSASSTGGAPGAGAPPPGLFDIFSPSTAAAGQSPEVASGVSRVQQALMRKVGHKMGVSLEPGSGRLQRKARDELTEQEALELDRHREELATLRSDKDVLEWGLRTVFGLSASSRAGILPDPSTLLVELPPSIDGDAAGKGVAVTVGPSSRLFPDLLHLLFLSLRDTHRSPNAALSVFALAASNPFSYISGCTTALYNEVLRTRWAEGDVESLLASLEEMRAAGVALDDRTRELVSAVGEAMRVDEERADVRVSALVDSRQLGGATGILDERERQVEVLKRRFFSAHQVDAWGRMDRIVEENLSEMARERRERDEDRWHAQEHARLSLDDLERDAAERERPSLVSRRSLSPYDEGQSAYSSSSSSGRRGGASSRGGGGQMTEFGWRDPVPERDEDGRLSLPKRPSFANPYKIRRKSLTKAEKSSKDNKHPALWWKN